MSPTPSGRKSLQERYEQIFQNESLSRDAKLAYLDVLEDRGDVPQYMIDSLRNELGKKSEMDDYVDNDGDNRDESGETNEADDDDDTTGDN